MYESFYLRAVSPTEPIGVWIRYTVDKRPGLAPTGSLWFTRFDARRGRPLQLKTSTDALAAPADAWIAIGESVMGPDRAKGSCGAASWSLRVASGERELRHLSPAWIYRAPLPRTKLTSPSPAALLTGTVQLAGEDPLELHDWPGMVGHNWGSEHAARWIWLHGVGFEDHPDAWLDVALGRIELAGRMTPWVANGVLSLAGRRHRLGGLAARRPDVTEDVDGCLLALRGPRGVSLQARVEVPADAAAGWRYTSPDGGEHDVVNCSVARLRLTVGIEGDPNGPAVLQSAHGGAYELGMREHDHGIPIAAG
jgi:hypothetical protein